RRPQLRRRRLGVRVRPDHGRLGGRRLERRRQVQGGRLPRRRRRQPAGAGTAYFSLDSNGNLGFDAGTDAVFLFGLTSDQFVGGNWNVTPPTLPAQFAAAGPGPGGAAALTDTELAPVLSRAIADRAAAGADPARLSTVQVEVGD